MIASMLVKGRPGINSGAIGIITPDFSAIKRAYLPPMCTLIEKYGSGDNFGNRQYINGLATAPLMIDEDDRCLRQGMLAPQIKPNVVSNGAGTFVQLCAVRFYDEVTQERSPLSDFTTITGAEDRTWDDLPTQETAFDLLVEGEADIAAGVVTGTAAANFENFRPGDKIAVDSALTQWAKITSIDSATSMAIDDTTLAGTGIKLVVRPVPRATHVELWVSVDGSFFRFLKRVRLGTTTVTEAINILAAGEPELESFIQLPISPISTLYHKRLIVGVGDSVHLSVLEFPERYGGLTFKTYDNEQVTGFLNHKDYVLVFTRSSTYRLQGYTDNDYTLTRVDRKIGSCGHHCNFSTDTVAFVTSRLGVQVFNGSYHNGMDTRKTEWKRKYRAHRVAYEMGVGAVNTLDGTFQYLPYMPRWFAGVLNTESLLPYDAQVWVGHYDGVAPQPGGELVQPEWLTDGFTTPLFTYLDEEENEISLYGVVTYMKEVAPSGTGIGEYYRGDSFGRIFEEGRLDNENNSAFHADSIIVPGHDFPHGFGGDFDSEGCKFTRGWSYVKSEFSAWEVRVSAGDDMAYPPQPADPDKLYSLFVDQNLWWSKSKYSANASYSTGSATAPITGNDISVRLQPKTVHQYGHIDCEGRGFTHTFVFYNPIAVEWLGYGYVASAGSVGTPPFVGKEGE